MEKVLIKIVMLDECTPTIEVTTNLRVKRVGKILNDIPRADVLQVCKFLKDHSQGKAYDIEVKDWEKVLENIEQNQLIHTPNQIHNPSFREIILKFFGARIQPPKIDKSAIFGNTRR